MGAVSAGAENWAKLVPELVVTNIDKSLDFWCGLIGFQTRYDRPEEKFAYLDLNGAQLMLEENDPAQRHWITAQLEKPLGRGINFQVETDDLDGPLERLRAVDWPLFLQPEEKWYRRDDIETGQKQFLVQDPDGYLLRLVQWIGDRPAIQ